MRQPSPAVSGRRPISVAPVSLLSFFVSKFTFFACLRFIVRSEALAELQSLQEVVDVLANFVHAPVGRRQERLLGACLSVRQAIEHGVRRGAAVVLAMAQVATDAELTDVEGFSPGQGLADYVDLLPDYEPAVNVVAAIVPVDQDL